MPRIIKKNKGLYIKLGEWHGGKRRRNKFEVQPNVMERVLAKIETTPDMTFDESMRAIDKIEKLTTN